MTFWASTIWTVLAGVLKMVFGLVSYYRERDARKKRLKKEALAEMKEGLKARDPQKITDAFSKMRRAKL